MKTRLVSKSNKGSWGGFLSVAAVSAVILTCSGLQAAVYIDTFDREELGPDYDVYINPTGAFIQSGEYVSIPSGAPYQTLGSYNGFTLLESFSASVAVRLPVAGSGGIAFNILNDGADFYAFRAFAGSTDLQLIKYTDGAIGGLSYYANALTNPLGTGGSDYYTLAVSSTEEGVFQLSLSDQSNAVLFSTSYTDTFGVLTGGMAGIYADSTTVAANVFKVESVPEPGAFALMALGVVVLIPLLRKRLKA